MHYEIWANFEARDGDIFTVYWLGPSAGFSHARQNKPFQLAYIDARQWLDCIIEGGLPSVYTQLRIMHLLGPDWTETAEKVFPLSPLEMLARCAE